MTPEEVLAADTNAPVLLVDGRFGLLIRKWDGGDIAGIQVPGEEQIRAIHCARLEDVGGGALQELPHLEEIRPMTYAAVRASREREHERVAANEGKGYRCASCADTGSVPAPEPYGSMGCRWQCPSCRQPGGVLKA